MDTKYSGAKSDRSSKQANVYLQYLLLGFHAVCMILIYKFVEYPKAADSHTSKSYGHFQDVHVMIFIGFGFLMTFLKDYNWSSVGFNFLIASLAIEWNIVVFALFHKSEEHPTTPFDFEIMFESEFAAGAVLISFGALLGKVSHLQLVIMTIFEIAFYRTNAWLLTQVLPMEGEALFDIGGSLVIHAFGAYFGLAASKVLTNDRHKSAPKEGSSYTSDLFAMIGTIFLWMFWPSFNSIPATDDFERQNTIANTYLALVAACITTFAVTGFSDKERRFDMVHIQNATLAGGVAMGSAANMVLHPVAPLIVGTLAGLVSTVGYQHLLDFICEKVGIHDTCGVHNLHGMPGIMGAIFSIVIGCSANPDTFSAALQIKALAVTLGMSIGGGAITAYAMSLVERRCTRELFEDDEHWIKEE